MGVVIALDRAEVRSIDDPMSAVQAVERDLSIPVVSIITLVELQHFLEGQPSDEYDTSTLQSVVDYRKEYGAL
jgi:orotate phosphoribosyltransferase